MATVALAVSLAVVVVVLSAVSYAVWRALRAFCNSPWQLPGVVARIVGIILKTLVHYIGRGFKPRFPEWTFLFEVTRAVLYCVTSHYGDRVTSHTNARIIRSQSEWMGNFIGRKIHQTNQTKIEPFTFNKLEHLWVRSVTDNLLRGETPSTRVVVLYFHGGGYVILSPRLYQGLASELQVRLQKELSELVGHPVQVDVLLANYRKAPEYPYPRPPQDALVMYKYLLDEEKLSPHQILVMGDSAGGGLTMTTLLRLRDENPLLLPIAGILSCPFVDRENEGDERETPYCILSDRLIQAFGEAYYKLEGPPSSWGDASPYHCDLHGLPPVLIQVGDFDYLRGHSKRLYEKSHASGLHEWSLEVYPNVPHDFTLLPPVILPIAAKGIQSMVKYAATQFARGLKQLNKGVPGA